jgi:hypothetical protein
VFAVDWKKHAVGETVEKLFAWPKVAKELRVRTAIDSEKLRAEKEKLFGYEMVDPSGLDWLAMLDLSRVEEPDRGQVLEDLQQLLSAGLGPLGKTKTDAETWLEPSSAFQPRVPSDVRPLAGNRWVITLQTPMILCTPEDLRWSKDATPAEKLLAGYRRVFSELSCQSLMLERFFAKQSLSSMRFAEKLPKDRTGNYYPLILTDAGSTFILRSAGHADAAQQVIESWLANGIPLANSLAGLIDRGFDPKAEDAWRHCPILDRHGYGEILVNPPWLRNNVPNSDWPIALVD